MDFNHISVIFQILTNTVVICTSLLFGFSFVNIKLKPIFKPLSFLSILVSLLAVLVSTGLSDAFSLLAIYFTLMVICLFVLRVPRKQTIIALLLALAFNLTVIQLFAYNVFNIGLLFSVLFDVIVIHISFYIFFIFLYLFFIFIIFL